MRLLLCEVKILALWWRKQCFRLWACNEHAQTYVERGGVVVVVSTIIRLANKTSITANVIRCVRSASFSALLDHPLARIYTLWLSRVLLRRVDPLSSWVGATVEQTHYQGNSCVLYVVSKSCESNLKFIATLTGTNWSSHIEATNAMLFPSPCFFLAFSLLPNLLHSCRCYCLY